MFTYDFEMIFDLSGSWSDDNSMIFFETVMPYRLELEKMNLLILEALRDREYSIAIQWAQSGNEGHYSCN